MATDESSIPNKPPEASLIKYNSPLQIEALNAGPKLSGTEELLDKLLPNRVWTDKKGQLRIQYVSSTPATQVDVKLLEKKLDASLKKQGAKPNGICYVRSKLHEECFDELVRQVAIMCSARGILLKRVHEDIRLRIKTYQTLFESTNAYGIRSALKGSKRKEEMQARVQELDRTNRELEDEINMEIAKREKLLAAETARVIQKQQTHQGVVKKAREDYDVLMAKYVEHITVSFEEKKKKGKR